MTSMPEVRVREGLGSLEKLRAALEDPGPKPAVHFRAMHNLKNEWPTLWNALMEVLYPEFEIEVINQPEPELIGDGMGGSPYLEPADDPIDFGPELRVRAVAEKQYVRGAREERERIESALHGPVAQNVLVNAIAHTIYGSVPTDLEMERSRKAARRVADELPLFLGLDEPV